MKVRNLESLALFVLVLTIFRIYNILDVLLIAVSGALVLLFIVLSETKFRILPVILLAIIIHGYLLKSDVESRIRSPLTARIHDGAVQTEEATRAFLSGENPYQISYENVLKGDRFLDNSKPHSVVTHYTYSPLAFVTNVPVMLLSEYFLKFTDYRLNVRLFFLLSWLILLVGVRERVLFSIFFLFNPLYINLLSWGTTDGIAILFIFLTFIALYFKKTTLATIACAMAVGVKVTAVPFVPLYFLFIWWSSPTDANKFKNFLYQITIFVGITLVIYLPFFLWNGNKFYDNFIAYLLIGGSKSWPMEGVIGIFPQLSNLGLISKSTNFPIFLIQIVITFLFMAFIYRAINNRLGLSLLAKIFSIFFIIFFSFSRIFQPSFLDFISQFVVLSAFIKEPNRQFTNKLALVKNR